MTRYYVGCLPVEKVVVPVPFFFFFLARRSSEYDNSNNNNNVIIVIVVSSHTIGVRTRVYKKHHS